MLQVALFVAYNPMNKLKTWTIHSIQKSWQKLKIDPRMTRRQKAWRATVKAGLYFLGSFLLLSFCYFLWLLLTFDPLSGIPKDSTLIMDREGNLLYTIH